MKRVYVLRHAKSSWKDTTLPDYERPLAGRGRRAAKAMARHLEETGTAVELVLCSPAARAVQTLDRIRPALGGAEVQVAPDLYGAGAERLLDRVRRLPPGVGSVMIIGHNPALQDLALDLARSGPSTDQLAEKYPTGALLELEFPVDTWTEVGSGGGDLVRFVRPRDLVE
jgi:phosphohistidine phosphatase